MVTTSFVLPKPLDAAVEKQAKIEMGNKSDIIRRACLNYLPESVRKSVLNEMPPLDLAPNPPPGHPEAGLNYNKKGKK